MPDPAVIPNVLADRYASPEMRAGRLTSPASDLFSLGCVIYECLTGTRAFDGQTVADVCAALSDYLHRSGHDVREAANGRDGVALHRERPADLVITDLFMPEQDGIETIQQIREFAPETPLLAMSGGGSRGNTDSLEDAELFGADAVLMKPFSPEDLDAAVAKVLGGG